MATIDIAMESTSQQILNAITSSGGSGYSSGMAIFEENGTFTVPDGVGIIYVTASGGGGGGGGATASYSGAGGGGGEGCGASAGTSATGGKGGNGNFHIRPCFIGSFFLGRARTYMY